MRVFLPLAILAMAVLSACHGGNEAARPAARKLQVSDSWVRLAAVPNDPAAAYFTLYGGPTDDKLISVTSPEATRSEMHETMSGSEGMATMTPLREVVVPAGSVVAFTPGGRHIMLFGLAQSITPGRDLRLDFTFASGAKLSTEAKVRPLGDAGP